MTRARYKQGKFSALIVLESCRSRSPAGWQRRHAPRVAQTLAHDTHTQRTANGRRPAHDNGARAKRAPGLAGRADSARSACHASLHKHHPNATTACLLHERMMKGCLCSEFVTVWTNMSIHIGQYQYCGLLRYWQYQYIHSSSIVLPNMG